MREWIEPAEAFRRLLRARYPQHAAVAGGADYRWIWYPESAGVSPDALQAVAAVLEELLEHIKEHRIRLRGELDSSRPPEDIDEVSAAYGRLNIWDRPSLTGTTRHKAGDLIVEGEGWGIDRVYRRVMCNACDVTAVCWPRLAEVNRDLAHSEPTLPVQPPSELKQASDSKIRDAIRAVYDGADKTGAKPPNIRELPKDVRVSLRQSGFDVSEKRVADIGGEDEFKRRRRPPGKTLASERE